MIDLLDCYGLPLVPTRIVADADEAVSAAASSAARLCSRRSPHDLVHKTDAGGVLLGLDGADAVRAGALRIKASMASVRA